MWARAAAPLALTEHACRTLLDGTAPFPASGCGCAVSLGPGVVDGWGRGGVVLGAPVVEFTVLGLVFGVPLPGGVVPLLDLLTPRGEVQGVEQGGGGVEWARFGWAAKKG